MLIVSVLVPLSNLPQFFKIGIYKSVSGVSVVSWIFFATFSFIWLIYWVLHKDRPIIIMHSLLVIVQVFIAVGAFTYV